MESLGWTLNDIIGWFGYCLVFPSANMATNNYTNSLAPGRCASYFTCKMLSPNICYRFCSWGFLMNALKWRPINTFDDKSTLTQVMAWCHQATSHYLSQCWPKSMSTCGFTRIQWVDSMRLGEVYLMDCHHFSTKPSEPMMSYYWSDPG